MRLLAVVLVLGLLNGFGTVSAQTWTDRSFNDFSKGVLDASGQNLYIAASGGIRSIRRYDMNQDGYIDLLFNSTHDFANDPPATLAMLNRQREVTSEALDVPGSLYCVPEDLDNDGFPDLVFCPAATGIQHPRRFITVIMGAAEGWTRSRTQGLLPVENPLDVVVADVNGDGWKDIAALCSDSRSGKRIVKLFWGSADGYRLNNTTSMAMDGGSHIAAGDLNGDGQKEAIVADLSGTIYKIAATKTEAIGRLPENTKVNGLLIGAIGRGHLPVLLVTTTRKELLAYSPGKGKEGSTSVLLTAVDAQRLVLADLDKDGSPDLITTDFSILKAAGGEMIGGNNTPVTGVTVYWGRNGTFSKDRSLLIPVPYAIDAAAGDFDGDGNPDIGVAVYQSATKFDTGSRIFFGKGNRSFEPGTRDIATAGAHHAVTVPGKKGAGDLLVLSNSVSGTTFEKVPLWLYLGGEKGFSDQRLLKIPFGSGYESTAADLNADGKVDLLSVNSMHGGDIEDPLGGVNIFWGKDGRWQEPEAFTDRAILHEINASTTNVADLNKDGYLDIVVGFFDRRDGKPTKLVIYYGKAAGYDTAGRVAIPCEGRSSSPMIADLNKDGWLDIVVSSFSKDLLRIFWGSEKGFDKDQVKNIQAPQVIDLEIADLNSDGFLDLVISHYKDKTDDHHDAGISILWGSNKGYSNWNAQWLPGYTVLGPVVADFDADGYLDIFCPAYHGDNMRGQIAMYLYWGAATGFSKQNRSVFVGDSGSDALAADFNKDGLLDLAVANHTNGPDHGKAASRIYYNDGKRFSTEALKMDKFPVPGPHWMWNKDMGHIYNRGWQQHYTSRVFKWTLPRTQVVLAADADMPGASRVEAYYRASASEAGLTGAPWKRVDKTGSLDASDRYLQYRYMFVSDNGDRYPVLKQVRVQLN